MLELKINYKFNVNETLIYDFAWPRRLNAGLLLAHVKSVWGEGEKGGKKSFFAGKKITENNSALPFGRPSVIEI